MIRIQRRRHPISEPLTPDEQERFHNLLKLAKDSPFAGERENALAAAKRLADRHGLTLDEAATRVTPSRGTQTAASDDSNSAQDLGSFVHMTDYRIHLEKQRRDAALRDARERGLDRDSRRKRPSSSPIRNVRRSTARRDPQQHAWALVRETKLSYREISDITGLDIYQVVLMKIQVLRAA